MNPDEDPLDALMKLKQQSQFGDVSSGGSSTASAAGGAENWNGMYLRRALGLGAGSRIGN